MNYSSTQRFLQRVQYALENDLPVSDDDLAKLLHIHEHSSIQDADAIQDLENILMAEESEKKMGAKDVSMSEDINGEICGALSDSFSEKETTFDYASNDSKGASFEKKCFDSVAPIIQPSSPAPAPASTTSFGGRGSNSSEDTPSSIQPSSMLRWSIPVDDDPLVEQLNSIEIMSASILSRLQERYVRNQTETL